MTLLTRSLTRTLPGRGHPVSDYIMCRLLKEQGYSLPTNAKQIDGNQHPEREGQFAYLNDRATERQEAGQLVINVDTKKKELVGAYQNKTISSRPQRGDRPASVDS